MAVLTPSYGPDLVAALALHRSVLRHTAPDVIHHLVVPEEDRRQFEEHASTRLVVHSTHDFVPARFRSVYRFARPLRRVPRMQRLAKIQAVDVRRPWPPLRGWMIQQLVKLAAPAELGPEIVVSIDSDSALIRPIGVETFTGATGHPLLHALPGAIPSSMKQHVGWLDTAGRLIGLPASQPPRTDYITPVVAWHRDLVIPLLARISAVTGRGDWRDAVAPLRTFSECMLYGRYAEECLPTGTVEPTTRSSCLTYWPERPLRAEDIPALLSGLTGDELAITIQSVSQTDPAVRARTVELAEQRVAAWVPQAVNRPDASRHAAPE